MYRTHPTQPSIDLVATVTEECAVYPDDGSFLLHAGETYDIDSMGNKGVIILTPFGKALLAWRSFRWAERKTARAERVLTDYSGIVVEAPR
jgi:hypothetical protein